MTTGYTSLLGLALPVTGELSGTWGDTVNDYITKYTDDAIAGVQVISGTQTAVTLSKTTNSALTQVGAGSTGSSQYAAIKCSGTPASTLTITVSSGMRPYLIVNATSQSVKIVGSGPTTGVTLVAGTCAVVIWDGADFVLSATNDAAQLSGTLGSAHGGTGLTTFTAANRALYSTSSSALTAGTLPVAAGGTGLTSGTSGGVPYFSGTGTIASSGALAASALVVGGGAGVAPSTTTTGTGVITAIGNDINTTGGVVTTDGTATLTNKTLTSPTINNPTLTGVSGLLIRAPQIKTTLTSYTTPANCTKIYVEIVGGGGAGGGGSGSGTNAGGGGGGGSGGYVAKYFSVSGNTAYSYAIGAGGTSSAGGNGTAGGNTTFTVGGTTITAGGGSGGTNGSAGGAGGTATNGDLNVAGNGGGASMQYGGNESGGIGAGSFFGGGARSVFAQGNTSGAAATGYGGGGAGGTTSSGSGGAGFQGVIRIWEYT